MPFTPPTPQEIIAAASEQVTNVVNAVATQLTPIGDAAQDATSSITQTADAFTSAVREGLGAIQTTINNAVSELQKQQGISLIKLHELLGNLPEINLPDLITVNGKGIEANPDVFYTTIRDLLTKPDPIVIEFHGPFAAPLQPLTSADLHTSLRRIVLPAFGLPPNSAVLNSDPVTITALIIIAIIVLGLPLTAAMGIAIAAIFLALAAVLIIAAIQGRKIEATTCPNVTIGAGLPGIPSGINIPMTLCTTIKIT